MATASTDCTVKIWDLDYHNQVCEDNKADFYGTLTDFAPMVSLTQHTNSMRTCTFHPTVTNLLVTTSQDMTLRCFDVQQGSQVSCLNVYKDFSEQSQFVNLSFNYNGSLLALASKDRIVRIVDPRANAVVAQTESHLKVFATPSNNRIIGRNLRVEWCNVNKGACDPICTVSAGSNGLRQLHLWDPRNLSAPGK